MVFKSQPCCLDFLDIHADLIDQLAIFFRRDRQRAAKIIIAPSQGFFRCQIQPHIKTSGAALAAFRLFSQIFLLHQLDELIGFVFINDQIYLIAGRCIEVMNEFFLD